jgi:hypothetical protein
MWTTESLGRNYRWLQGGAAVFDAGALSIARVKAYVLQLSQQPVSAARVGLSSSAIGRTWRSQTVWSELPEWGKRSAGGLSPDWLYTLQLATRRAWKWGSQVSIGIAFLTLPHPRSSRRSLVARISCMASVLAALPSQQYTTRVGAWVTGQPGYRAISRHNASHPHPLFRELYLNSYTII